MRRRCAHGDARLSGIMRKACCLLWFVIAVVVLTGCGGVTIGQKIDTSLLPEIERGKTTRAEIFQMFGEPHYTNLQPGGGIMLMYTYTHVSSGLDPLIFLPIVAIVDMLAGSTETYQESLQVIISKEGTVEDYHFSKGSYTTRTGLLNQ